MPVARGWLGVRQKVDRALNDGPFGNFLDQRFLPVILKRGQVPRILASGAIFQDGLGKRQDG